MHNLTLHKDINMNVYIYINNLYFFIHIDLINI